MLDLPHRINQDSIRHVEGRADGLVATAHFYDGVWNCQVYCKESSGIKTFRVPTVIHVFAWMQELGVQEAEVPATLTIPVAEVRIPTTGGTNQ